MLGPVDVVGMMQAAPAAGAVERMGGVGNEDQAQNGRSLLGPSMVRSPIQVELCQATGQVRRL